MSLYTLVLLGLMPVGGLLMGALATQFGSAAAHRDRRRSSTALIVARRLRAASRPLRRL